MNDKELIDNLKFENAVLTGFCVLAIVVIGILLV